MPIGIAEINIHGMAGAVAPWSALDIAAKSKLSGDIAGSQELIGLRCKICEVMQTRTITAEENNVMRIAFALQEGATDIFIRRTDIFR